MRKTALAALACGAAWSACSAPWAPAAPPLSAIEARYLGRTVDPPPAGETADSGEAACLTIVDAVRAALANRPDLAVAATAIGLAEARRVGALAYPNPSARATASDDDAGDGARPKLWLEVEQPIVLGGRRRLGADQAALEAEAAAWDLLARKVEVVAEASAAFVEVVAAQALAALAEENLAAVAEATRVAEARRAAERGTELDAARARTEEARAHAALAGAFARLAVARARLLGAMGTPGGAPPVCAAPGRPLPVFRSGDGEETPRALESHPAVLAARARLDAAEVGTRRAEAEATPDLTVGVGYGQALGPAESLWTVSVGVPLPLFDRNRGGRAEAAARRTRAAADLAATEVATRTALRAAMAERDAALAELELLLERLVPLATETLARAEAAFREGRADHIVLLDARRARTEARAGAIDADLRLQLASIRIESLIGYETEAPR